MYVYIYIYVRCNNENTRFLPVGLGGDGAPTPQFVFFLSKACDSAIRIKGLNRLSFETHARPMQRRLSLKATSYYYVNMAGLAMLNQKTTGALVQRGLL